MATIIVCDICSTRKNVKRMSWAIDRQMDPAGSMDTISKTVDLCPSCEAYLLRRVLCNTLGEKIQNRPAIEMEYGKRMWEEYRKVMSEATNETTTV